MYLLTEKKNLDRFLVIFIFISPPRLHIFSKFPVKHFIKEWLNSGTGFGTVN